MKNLPSDGGILVENRDKDSIWSYRFNGLFNGEILTVSFQAGLKYITSISSHFTGDSADQLKIIVGGEQLLSPMVKQKF